MAKLKVNVVIAGRTYPLSVSNIEEEEGMRKAAKNINNLIARFEQSYAVADKQDVLAMSALQFASKVEIEAINNKKEEEKALQKIKELTKLVDSHL
jgi:cell division protein ZapA